MKIHRWKSLLMTVALCLLLIPATQSQAATKYSLGAGVGMAPDYEGSNDYEAIPLLLGSAQFDNGRYLKLKGLHLSANLVADSIWEAGPILNYRQGRDDVDDDQVDNLSRVDDAVELGVFGGFKIENWSAHLAFLQDISDEHDGWLITLRGEYREEALNDLGMTLGAFTTYASDDYMDAFFTIDERDSNRSGFETFNADAGLKDIGLDLSLDYTPWENWGIFGLASYKRLLSDAKDSPVVDDAGDANQWVIGAGAIYRF